jgi:hypothetical protein
MGILLENRPRLADLEQAIKDRIAQYTSGRIRMLEVSVFEDHIAISGVTTSFYHKQLAIQGLLFELGLWQSDREFRIDMQIAVRPAKSNAVLT